MLLSKWLIKQRRNKSQMINFYKEVFQRTYAGKYVLADICRHGCIDQNTFNPGSDRMTSFNEGRRAMALHILNTLSLNPNEYVNQFHLEMTKGADDVD